MVPITILITILITISGLSLIEDENVVNLGFRFLDRK